MENTSFDEYEAASDVLGKKAILKTLTNLDDAQTRQILQKALRDRDSSIYETALNLLAEIDMDGAMQLLVDTFISSDWYTKIPIIKILPHPSFRQKEEAVQLLLLGLADSHSGVRGLSASILSEIKNPIAINPLINRLNDPDKYVRICTIEALSMFDEIEVIEPLVEMLADEDYDIYDLTAVQLQLLLRAKGNRNNSELRNKLRESLNKKYSSIKNPAAQKEIEILGYILDELDGEQQPQL